MVGEVVLRLATLLSFLLACSTRPSNGVPPVREEAQPKLVADNTMRVGNQAAGVEEQPDYDRAALEIREKVQERLPDPLPPPKVACVSMYDAAIEAYSKAEGAGSPPVKLLQQTKRTGIEACQAETTPAAASCVAVLAALDGGEFPWLLDQCSRAFP
jgi:hypothetical protein